MRPGQWPGSGDQRGGLKLIFDADSEYRMAKALGAVEDETAAGLLKEKSNQFRGLTRAKEISLKSPTAELQKWRDYEAGMPAVLSGKITESLRQRFAAEAQTVGKELTDPATGELFFRTPAGKAVLAHLPCLFDIWLSRHRWTWTPNKTADAVLWNFAKFSP